MKKIVNMVVCIHKERSYLWYYLKMVVGTVITKNFELS